jgi:methylated-DNA-protein-cysteine methyltransferase-like protein
MFDFIYQAVKEVPYGQVATYGQIAHIVKAPTPRVIGYALSALPAGTHVPWQRIVNAQGMLSPRNNHNLGATEQQILLEQEGIKFHNHQLCFKTYAWQGPTPMWIEENNIEPTALMHDNAGKPGAWINWAY